MERAAASRIHSIGKEFQIPGEMVSAAPYGSGHINDTYSALYAEGREERRYIHQRINRRVFQDPVGLMENLVRITGHIRKRLQQIGTDQTARTVLTIIPARNGRAFHQDGEGEYWRTYPFLEGLRSYDAVQSPVQAFEAAQAFATFQSLLSDLPPPPLTETIAGFHDTPARYSILQQAVEEDAWNRAAAAANEIELIQEHASILRSLAALQQRGELLERAVHNDTKLNNVLFDARTQRWACVIDLDTVMPGLAAYDFGDLVRTATSYTREDGQDPDGVRMEIPLFDAIVRGYLEGAKAFLTPSEKDSLLPGGKLITLEAGIRFLTDYLTGDSYFKIERVGQNLDRCRIQLKLFEEILHGEVQLQEVIDRVWTHLLGN